MTFAMNASLQDLSQTLAGIVALTPVLFAAGYFVNRGTGILIGRDAPVMDKLGASLVLSVGILPVFLHLIGRISMAGTHIVFWASAAAFAIILWRKREHVVPFIRERATKSCMLIALGWIVLSVALQIDLEWDRHVYPSSIVVDQALRIGTVGAVDRAAVLPPEDPFLRLGARAPLGYHYFWYILCDVVCREAPAWIGTRGAIMAGTTWMGLALWASLSLWLRNARREREWMKLRWVIAAFLLAISGLDAWVGIILIVHRLFAWHLRQWLPFASLDWWNSDQLTNWLDAMIWVPHCAAALVACATGLLVLLKHSDGNRKRGLVSAIVSGACFASAAGMSIYVAFGCAIAMGAYLVFLAIRRNSRSAVLFVGSGGVAVVLAAPYLNELLTNVASPDFLRIGLHALPGGIYRILPGVFSGAYGRLVRYLFLAPTLAVIQFVEFGFWLVAAIYWWKTRKSDSDAFRRWLLILLFATSIILTNVVRSSPTNDLGMRATFCGQFALAVMAGEWLLRRFAEPRMGSLIKHVKALPRLASILLVAGLFTTVAEAAVLRTYLVLQDWDMVGYRFIDWSDLGASIASTRNAYEWLQTHSDAGAVVQLAPSDNALYLVGGYSDRQTIVTGRYQLAYRAKYRPELDSAITDVGKVFVDRDASRSDVASTCSQRGIRFLVVTSHDPVWNAANSWVRHASPVYQDGGTRVYQCPVAQ